MLNITKDEANTALNALLLSPLRTKNRLKLINKILSAYPELERVKDRFDVQESKLRFFTLTTKK